jgi:hypothetical protein
MPLPIHSKRAALHARSERDAHGRRCVVPLFDLLDASGRYLIQVPDHPADFDPLRTRHAVLTVVDTNDTNRRSSSHALYLVPCHRYLALRDSSIAIDFDFV